MAKRPMVRAVELVPTQKCGDILIAKFPKTSKYGWLDLWIACMVGESIAISSGKRTRIFKCRDHTNEFHVTWATERLRR